jgi:hypothetical protein
MRRLYRFSARVCGSLAFLCAMLALSTLPRAFADPGQGVTCESCCQGYGLSGEELQQCVSACNQGSGVCGWAVVKLSKCPNADPKACSFRNNKMLECLGSVCVEVGKGQCDCTYDSGNGNCNCPQ